MKTFKKTFLYSLIFAGFVLSASHASAASLNADVGEINQAGEMSLDSVRNLALSKQQDVVRDSREQAAAKGITQEKILEAKEFSKTTLAPLQKEFDRMNVELGFRNQINKYLSEFALGNNTSEKISQTAKDTILAYGKILYPNENLTSWSQVSDRVKSEEEGFLRERGRLIQEMQAKTEEFGYGALSVANEEIKLEKMQAALAGKPDPQFCFDQVASEMVGADANIRLSQMTELGVNDSKQPYCALKSALQDTSSASFEDKFSPELAKYANSFVNPQSTAPVARMPDTERERPITAEQTPARGGNITGISPTTGALANLAALSGESIDGPGEMEMGNAAGEEEEAYNPNRTNAFAAAGFEAGGVAAAEEAAQAAASQGRGGGGLLGSLGKLASVGGAIGNLSSGGGFSSLGKGFGSQMNNFMNNARAGKFDLAGSARALSRNMGGLSNVAALTGNTRLAGQLRQGSALTGATGRAFTRDKNGQNAFGRLGTGLQNSVSNLRGNAATAFERRLVSAGEVKPKTGQ